MKLRGAHHSRTRTYAHAHSLSHMHVHMHMHVRMHMHIHMHMHVLMRIHIHILMNVHVRMLTQVQDEFLRGTVVAVAVAAACAVFAIVAFVRDARTTCVATFAIAGMLLRYHTILHPTTVGCIRNSRI